MPPASLLQDELVNEYYIMHVFTHFKVSGDFSVTPTVTWCIEAEHSDRDIWFIHADAIEETSFYVSCRPVQSTENFNSNSNCHNSMQASLTLIFFTESLEMTRYYL